MPVKIIGSIQGLYPAAKTESSGPGKQQRQKGWGRIQRRARKLFDNPKGVVSVRGAACKVYGVDEPTRSMLVSLRRVLPPIAKKKGWRRCLPGGAGSSIVYMSPEAYERVGVEGLSEQLWG